MGEESKCVLGVLHPSFRFLCLGHDEYTFPRLVDSYAHLVN